MFSSVLGHNQASIDKILLIHKLLCSRSCKLLLKRRPVLVNCICIIFPCIIMCFICAYTCTIGVFHFLLMSGGVLWAFVITSHADKCAGCKFRNVALVYSETSIEASAAVTVVWEGCKATPIRVAGDSDAGMLPYKGCVRERIIHSQTPMIMQASQSALKSAGGNCY